MQFEEYEKDVLRTFPEDNDRDLLINFTLGIVCESGEFANNIKKYLYHGHGMFEEHLDELGDVLWYIAALAKIFDSSLDEIAKLNIEKRQKRYPEGFDPKKSLYREG